MELGASQGHGERSAMMISRVFHFTSSCGLSELLHIRGGCSVQVRAGGRPSGASVYVDVILSVTAQPWRGGESPGSP